MEVQAMEGARWWAIWVLTKANGVAGILLKGAKNVLEEERYFRTVTKSKYTTIWKVSSSNNHGDSVYCSVLVQLCSTQRKYTPDIVPMDIN